METTRAAFYPPLYLNCLERIITDALEDHEGPVSIGGRTITNLRFADDIDGLTWDEQELVDLVNRLNKTSARPAEWKLVLRKPS